MTEIEKTVCDVSFVAENFVEVCQQVIYDNINQDNL